MKNMMWCTFQVDPFSFLMNFKCYCFSLQCFDTVGLAAEQPVKQPSVSILAVVIWLELCMSEELWLEPAPHECVFCVMTVLCRLWQLCCQAVLIQACNTRTALAALCVQQRSFRMKQNAVRMHELHWSDYSFQLSQICRTLPCLVSTSNPTKLLPAIEIEIWQYSSNPPSRCLSP